MASAFSPSNEAPKLLTTPRRYAPATETIESIRRAWVQRHRRWIEEQRAQLTEPGEASASDPR